MPFREMQCTGRIPCRVPATARDAGSFDSAWTSLREVHAPLRMTTLGWAGASRSFFEGWDFTVVSRVGFLLTPAAPSFIEFTDGPHHPPLRLRSGQALFATCAKRMGRVAVNLHPLLPRMIPCCAKPPG